MEHKYTWYINSSIISYYYLTAHPHIYEINTYMNILHAVLYQTLLIGEFETREEGRITVNNTRCVQTIQPYTVHWS